MPIKFVLLFVLLQSGLGFSQPVFLKEDSLFCLSLCPKTAPIFPFFDKSNPPFIKNRGQMLPLIDGAAAFHENTLFKTHVGGLFNWQGSRCYLRLGALGGITNNTSLFVSNWFEKPLNNGINMSIMPMVRFGYKPTSYVSAQIGFDRNLYGDGNRSLFLSDIGKPYPFASLRFNLGPITYQSMVSYLFSPSYLNKFKVCHFFHWAVNQKLEFNVFESVLFNTGDTTSNRTFDPYYLNPFIFIRPQEYAIGSSDNVLIGFGASLSILKAKLYGQFVVDDFLISSLASGGKYWGNKWGLQLGWKHFVTKNKYKIMSRIEGNLVRPYTYSHLGPSLNYSNENSSLAHPYGANFLEVFESHAIIKEPFSLLVELSVGRKGTDYDNVSYGGDILAPYTLRPSDFNISILQGRKTDFVRSRIKLGYFFREKKDLEGYLELNVRYSRNTQEKTLWLFPVIGIKSRFYNDYRF